MQKKTLPNRPLIEKSSWKTLLAHQQKIAQRSILEHFDHESNRLDYTTFEWEDFYVDVSKNRIDQKGFELLLELAKESGLTEAINAQFSGAAINRTENRAVLHTCLLYTSPSPRD